MNKTELQKVDKNKYKQKRKLFEMSGEALNLFAKNGGEAASSAVAKELARRAKKKAKKAKKI